MGVTYAMENKRVKVDIAGDRWGCWNISMRR